MELLLLWFIALLFLSLPLWLLWNAWKKSRKLYSRLVFCDESLLTDSSVKVRSIIAAPPETLITENARFVVLPKNAQVYDQSMLFE